eukprot:2589618-Prymnesium_polylepis.1
MVVSDLARGGAKAGVAKGEAPTRVGKEGCSVSPTTGAPGAGASCPAEATALALAASVTAAALFTRAPGSGATCTAPRLGLDQALLRKPTLSTRASRA